MGAKLTDLNRLTIINPKLCLEWDFEENSHLDINKITCNNPILVGWKCLLKRHKWKARVSDRNKGNNCSYCLGKKACMDNCLATLNPKLSKEWHSILNGNLTPFDVTCNSNKKVWWLCEFGHFWEAVINSRTQGRKCPYCNNKKVNNSNCLAVLKPDLAFEWDYESNNGLTPFDFTCGSRKIVGWFCKNNPNHKWQASIKDRNRGSGCPICNESRGEKQTAKILDSFGIKFQRQWKEHQCKNVNILPFDFYLNEINKCIEYQGEQHYKSVVAFGGEKELIEVQKRDLIKFNYCKENNIPLLVISYWDFEKIEEFIKEFLKI